MRIALAVLVGLALPVTAGCLMDPQDEPETSSVESAATVLPMSGTWTYGETSTVSTTCKVSGVQHIESGPFEVSNVTSASFLVTPHDGTAPFTCKIITTLIATTSTTTFSCPTRAQFTRDLHSIGLDAVVTVRATASGQFLDSAHTRGKQDALVTCVGTQCSVIGTPCGFQVNFETHH